MSLPPVEMLLCQRLGVLPNFIGGTLRLNSKYSGPILQVYNGTTTLDVGSVSQIAAFCGASNGFVATIYDQSGNGRNFTQATTTKYPKIYDGGTTSLLRTNPRGPTVLRFDGVDDVLGRADSCGVTGTVGISVWQLASLIGAVSGGYCHFGTTGTTGGDFTPQYINNIAGSGQNVPRVTCQATDDCLFNDTGNTGTISHTYHDDLIEYPGSGTLTAGLTWRLNGVSLVLTNNGLGPGTPNFNTVASEIGSRTAANLPISGDISCVGMWTPKLTTADQAVLLKFGERWRLQ